MPRKGAAKATVRRTTGGVPLATPGHLADLVTAMDGPIDTSEIPEAKGRPARVRRDASGRVREQPPSPIRRAILAALGRRGMTRYQLWAGARKHCKTLSQSAVYEYLRGQRAINSVYLDALLRAAGLVVAPTQSVPSRTPSKATAAAKAR